MLITKQRCSGVTRADVSARGAEVVSAQLIRCVRAATMHKARCGATTAYCAWLEGIFTKKTRAQLHIRPWDMTPRHHNQLHPSPEQRAVQELEHAALTRAWTRGRHTSHVTLHVTHHTSSFCTVFCYLQQFFFKWEQIPMPNTKLQGSQLQVQKRNCDKYLINIM